MLAKSNSQYRSSIADKHDLVVPQECPICGSEWQIYCFHSSSRCPKCGKTVTNNSFYIGNDDKARLQLVLSAYDREFEHEWDDNFSSMLTPSVDLNLGSIVLDESQRELVSDAIRSSILKYPSVDTVDIHVYQSMIYSSISLSQKGQQQISKQQNAKYYSNHPVDAVVDGVSNTWAIMKMVIILIVAVIVFAFLGFLFLGPLFLL